MLYYMEIWLLYFFFLLIFAFWFSRNLLDELGMWLKSIMSIQETSIMCFYLEDKQYTQRKKAELRKETMGIFLWNLLVSYVPEYIDSDNMQIMTGSLIFSSLKSCSGLDWYLNKQVWTSLVWVKFKLSTELFGLIYNPSRKAPSN